MNTQELKEKVQEIYENYDAGEIDSGDALCKVVNLVKEYADVKQGEPNEYGEYLVKELKDALKTFGEYTYNDKGAYEVMAIDEYVSELIDMDIKEVADILTYVLDNHDNANEMVSCIIGEMEDREDFEELFELDNRFEY